MKVRVAVVAILFSLLINHSLSGQTIGPDRSIGVQGAVTTYLRAGDDYLYAIELQSDSKIVAVGAEVTSSAIGGKVVALCSYNVDGSLDQNFVVAGSRARSSQDFAAKRFNSDGTPDLTFNGGRAAYVDFYSGYDWIYALALEPDGGIILGGYIDSSYFKDFGLARLKSDGSLDNSFGTGGKMSTRFTAGSQVNALVDQSDGRILAAGQAYDLTHELFALARYAPTSAGASSQLLPHSIALTPNPVHDRATLDFDLTKPSIVRIEVVDVLGRVLQVVTEREILSSGPHSIPINFSSALAPGSYTMILRAGGSLLNI